MHSETPEHKIARLEDVIWKLEKQMDELGNVAVHRKKLLKRLYDASIGLLMIDDDDTDGLWLERILEAKKVMEDVWKELNSDKEHNVTHKYKEK